MYNLFNSNIFQNILEKCIETVLSYRGFTKDEDRDFKLPEVK